MKQFIYTILLLVLCTPTVTGQSLEAFQSEARQAYESGDFTAALSYSQIVLREEAESAEFLEIAGISALELCAFELGEAYLRQLRTLNPTGAPARIDFYLAKSQHRQGNYEEAIQLYRQFINAAGYGPEDEYVQLAQAKVTEAEAALDSEPVPGVEVTNYTAVNTGCASDFALPLFEDNFFHASLTLVDDPKKQCDCADPCRHRLSLYQTGGYGEEKVPLMPDLEGVGHITFVDEGRRAFFTMCECEEDRYTCALYYRDRDGKSGAWGPPVKLPATINQPDYTITQPHAFFNQREERYYLYYVTDYPGPDAKGGLDIWYTTFRGNDFSQPINQGDLNTGADEVTPFYHAASNTLYFSTNGRTSFGGYDFDIYYLPLSAEYPDDPVNAGLPYNSSFDDLYFSLNERGDRAYLSSNRRGSLCSETGSDFPYCCPDIFKVDIELETNLIVRTYCLPEPPSAYEYERPAGSPANEPVLNADLTLRNLSDGLSDYQPAWIESGYMHFYSGLPLQKDFEVVAEKTGYDPARQRFNTGATGKDTLQIELFLDPDINLEVNFRSANDPDRPVEIGNVRLVEAGTTDTLYLQEAGIGTYMAQLAPYSTYLLLPDTNSVIDQCFQFGKDRSREIVTTCDPGPVRETFSLESAVDSSTLEEPLPLYFDHAIPPVTSYASTTREAARDYAFYHTAYTNEVRQRQYRQALCSPRMEVQDFFKEVEDNINLMTFYADLLYTQLQQGGKRVEVTIRGFASASKSGGYSNDDLSARRIDSMRKFLENRFRELSREDPDYSARDLISRVTFVTRPRGDTGASNAPRTGTCRIYNVKAARDRRIEVVRITFYPESGPCSGLPPDYPDEPDDPYQQDPYQQESPYNRNNGYDGNRSDR